MEIKICPLSLFPGNLLETYRLFMSIEEGVAGGGGRDSRSSLGKAPGPRRGPPSLLGGNPTRLLLSYKREEMKPEPPSLRALPPHARYYLGPSKGGLASTQLLKGRTAGLSTPTAWGPSCACSCCSGFLLLPQGIALDLLPNQQLP